MSYGLVKPEFIYVRNSHDFVLEMLDITWIFQEREAHNLSSYQIQELENPTHTSPEAILFLLDEERKD